MGIARLKVTPDVLVALFRVGPPRCFSIEANGLPPETQVVGATYDLEGDLIILQLEHESFPPDAELPPVLARTIFFGTG